MVRLAGIAALEARIDAAFEATSIPAPGADAARWVVCSVGEDFQRFALSQAAAEWADSDWRTKRGHWIGQLDRYKYALKHALALCAKKGAPGGDRFAIGEKAYLAASELLFRAGADYATATRIFSSVHADGGGLDADPTTGRISISHDNRTTQYHSLELLLDVDRIGFSPTIYAGHLFSGLFPGAAIEPSRLALVHDIANRVTLDGGRIQYALITRLARGLLKDLEGQGSSLPADWRFPWGDVAAARAFYLGLQARCLYHLIAVHVGATRLGLLGLGLDQICLTLPRDQLLSQVARIVDVPRAHLKPVAESLTFGVETLHPDPALQPIVPIGGDRFAIPNMLVLSSDWQRNMLSLHARVSKRTFDTQSSIFERVQVKALMLKIPGQYAKFDNRTLEVAVGAGEEIDLIIIDPKCQTALVCELRWFLQPGDVREVVNRKVEIARKVIQARRKVGALAEPPMPWLKGLGIEGGPWRVRGVVVIEGFGGVPSGEPAETPVIPGEIFVKVLGASPSLEHAHAVLCSPLWLPQPGRDFFASAEPYDLFGEEFDLPVINLGQGSYMSESLPQILREAADLEANSLRALSW